MIVSGYLPIYKTVIKNKGLKMATRSTIWLQNEDGTVKGIYCHFDGYPSNNGKILLKHYTNKEKIEKLIALGALSKLEAKIEPENGEAHSFESPVDGVCIAYHRDRGKDLHIFELSNVDAIDKYTIEEWGYLFKDNKWYVKDFYDFADWTELTQEICDNN